MYSLKYTEILKKNAELKELAQLQPYNISVLSNITVNQLKEVIEYSLRTEGIGAIVEIGDYDNIVQDSLKFKDQDGVIVFHELSNIIDGFHYKLNNLSEKEFEALLNKTKLEIDFILENLSLSSIVIFNKYSSLIFNYDLLALNKFDEFCQHLNQYLSQKKQNNLILIDIDKIIAKSSVGNSVDFRYFYSSKALYGIDFFKNYSHFIKPIFLSIKGYTKKALIFDCDNTLWKGIIGEDGMEGIEMSSKTKDGKIFEEIQAIALELNKRGILLGICSKNNIEDVNNVLLKHPDMQLKDDCFTIKKINWDDKVNNLIAIAKELNIGIDSLVFIDDSDFEVNYIKSKLPLVTVLQVPQKLHQYPGMLRACTNLFYSTTTLSEEDKKRAELYKQEAGRNNAKQKFVDIEEYLRSLELKVQIYIDDPSPVSRIAQMTQKTNQFNLTTKRYTENDIKKFIEDKNYKVYAFEVEDKFGGYGITGLCILNFDDDKILVDTFLMSCRVIGRNIEFAFFDFIVSHISKKHKGVFYAFYEKTAKNIQVENFYDQLGFGIINKSDKGKNYKLDVHRYKNKDINYIQVLT